MNAEGTQLPFAPAYCGNCWPICFVTYGDNVGVVANTEEIADTLAVDEVTVYSCAWMTCAPRLRRVFSELLNAGYDISLRQVFTAC